MQYPIPKKPWTLGFIAFLAIIFVGGALYVNAAPTQPGSLTTEPSFGTDPLSLAEEQNISIHLTGLIQDNVRASSTQMETLLIERHQEEKGATDALRRGDAYIYDYATDTLIHAIIDLATGKTDEVERVQNVQLPLTEAEIARAVEITVKAEPFYKEIAQRYQEITGNELASIDELNIKAFTFRADSMPDRVNSAAEACGLNRCAQLLLYTQDQVVFEMMPIVNLSTSEVAQTMAFGGPETDSLEEPTGTTDQPDVQPADQSNQLYLPFMTQGGFDAK